MVLVTPIILWLVMGTIVFFCIKWTGMSTTAKLTLSALLGLVLLFIFWVHIIMGMMCDDDYNLYILGYNFSYMC